MKCRKKVKHETAEEFWNRHNYLEFDAESGILYPGNKIYYCCFNEGETVIEFRTITKEEYKKLYVS